ncbi:MAG: RNase H family protein [Archangium sp.]|nr:RNase H family protein [Archangium sp.]MDP3156839.1 RNase H family protein [Archangium sp.]MDP3569687.1 RNase H family protein [Archangium sp.]
MWHRVAGALKGPPLLELYCDGSADAHVAKPGGWAFLVVRYDEVLVSKTGRSASTTSLVMELEAARAALNEVIKRGWHLKHTIELISDSSIALDIAAGRFLPKRHVELARKLRATAATARAQTRWVRAHSGHRWNEAVDALAHQAKVRRRLRGSTPSRPDHQ